MISIRSSLPKRVNPLPNVQIISYQSVYERAHECVRRRERFMGLRHWVQHPIVHHLPAQAILILHLSLDPGKKRLHI